MRPVFLHIFYADADPIELRVENMPDALRTAYLIVQGHANSVTVRFYGPDAESLGAVWQEATESGPLTHVASIGLGIDGEMVTRAGIMTDLHSDPLQWVQAFADWYE